MEAFFFIKRNTFVDIVILITNVHVVVSDLANAKSH